MLTVAGGNLILLEFSELWIVDQSVIDLQAGFIDISGNGIIGFISSTIIVSDLKNLLINLFSLKNNRTLQVRTLSRIMKFQFEVTLHFTLVNTQTDSPFIVFIMIDK